MADMIRIGILGCGWNARRFAKDLTYSRECTLYAAASRSGEKAQAFADEFNARRAYDSYGDLAADADVDLVYIATPHVFHMEQTLLCIEAGRNVLCEKPLAINADQARRMQRAAKDAGVFLMEGMWTRFFPAMDAVRAWLAEGRIGDILAVRAEFGRRFGYDPSHRAFNPDLGGGALLDLGVYPIAFASMVLGRPPERIATTVHMADSGVDDQSTLTFEYPDAVTAALAAASRVTMNQDAAVFGTQGRILLPPNFYRPARAILESEDGTTETADHDHPGWGFQFEADHAAHCLRANMTESPLMPLAESIQILETTDHIRQQWGLRYAE